VAHALRRARGQPLDVVRAAPGIDRARGARFLLQEQLGVAGDAGEKSVGSASASSSALVCSDCVWPCVAAIASRQVRTTLLNTSCAVSDQPEVWRVRAQRQRLRVLRPNCFTASPTAGARRASWRPP
jgi:hypothetical protein